jgi:dTDP-4-amino-4,6-dideoxygalactose transaminase
MHIPFLDLKAQYASIKNEIDDALQSILDNASFIGGEPLREFEEKFSQYCTTKYCVGVGNGTDALIIGLRAIGIGEGDEVITVANSFVATSEAITAAGGKVVFADCHPDYYTIDTNDLIKKVSPRTKAIIPVHLYGQPANMPIIMKIARAYNLKVIEDCAQAHGALIEERRIGTYGDLATFSFYPGKNLGAYGDGGAIVTNNKQIAKKSRMIANHGRIDKYNHEFEGVNSRLDGLQCAILNIKLDFLNVWNEKRRNVAHLYSQSLKHVSEIVIPAEMANSKPVYHLYVIRTQRRDELAIYLKEKGISTGIHYPIALHNLNAYKYLEHEPTHFPVSNQYQNEILSLPIYPELSEESIKYITDSIVAFFINTKADH